MRKFNEFMRHLEAALGDPEQRRAFLEYVHKLTPEQQRGILAEAERCDPAGSLEWVSILDLIEADDRADLSGDEVN